MSATYFWSGSNRPGEIRALAKHGQPFGVTVTQLHSGLEELVQLGTRVVVNVTRARGGRPILMFNRERPQYRALPAGDVPVLACGERLRFGFRKVAVNAAGRPGDNRLPELLRRLLGPEAGAPGAGHRVALQLTRCGWTMSAAALSRARLRGLRVFVDSGAFSELGGDPITHEAWLRRLAAYQRIADALGDRAYLVTPDKVGDQAETLRRLRRYRDHVWRLREAGAQLIVPLQRGELDGAAFDRACADALGFDDYIRGIPSKKAAASVAEIAALSRCLPADARVHLLGLGTKGSRYDRVMEALGRPVELVSCDSCRIAALTPKSGGRGGGPRPLAVCTAEAKRRLGIPPGEATPRGRGNEVKELALDLLFEGGWN